MISRFLLVACLVILLLNNAKSKEVKGEKAEKKKQVVCQKHMSIFLAHAHHHQCKSEVITVVLNSFVI